MDVLRSKQQYTPNILISLAVAAAVRTCNSNIRINLWQKEDCERSQELRSLIINP
ncbi:hypothetical protein BJV78DRAFT_1248362 [Lactifluus subvellereus]|nr:hypothetical protein BJV78DRAFT_1248362 [Lactifluus subvellereus]